MTRRADPTAERVVVQRLVNCAASTAKAYRALSIALDRNRGRGLDRARELARARACDRDLARDLALTLDLTRDLDLDRDRVLDRVLDRELDRVRALDSDLAHARNRDYLLESKLTRERVDAVRGAQESVRLVMAAFVRMANVAGERARELDRHAAPGPRAHCSVQERPSPNALRLTTTAARLLPPVHRSRWREEYHAELHDLADTRASRRAQLAHALRVLTRSWAQRRALTAPHPGRERAR